MILLVLLASTLEHQYYKGKCDTLIRYTKMTTMTEKLMAGLAQRLTTQIDFKQVEIITMIEKRRTQLRSFGNDKRDSSPMAFKATGLAHSN